MFKPYDVGDLTAITNIQYYNTLSPLSLEAKKIIIDNTYISVFLPINPTNAANNSLMKVILDNNENNFSTDAEALDSIKATANPDELKRLDVYKKQRLVHILNTNAQAYKENVLYKFMVSVPEPVGTPTQEETAAATAAATINAYDLYYTSEQFSKVLSLLKDTELFANANAYTGNKDNYRDLYTAKQAALSGIPGTSLILGGGSKNTKNKITKRKRKNIRAKKNNKNTKKMQ